LSILLLWFSFVWCFLNKRYRFCLHLTFHL
jgi:hypothetical protein